MPLLRDPQELAVTVRADLLRHRIRMLFRHGGNAKQVQRWLGHHSPAFTLATYVHLLPSDLPEPPAIFDAKYFCFCFGR